MKSLMTIVFLVLAAITAKVSFIWAIVEFIIYLVKDKPFNWHSVWLTIGSIILTIILYIVYYVVESKGYEAKRELRQIRNKKSKWQERLEKAAEQRAANAE